MQTNIFLFSADVSAEDILGPKSTVDDYSYDHVI